jgi:hypothetical protein
VLCDLAGRPRKEAARQLGVPEGTLSSRLASARKLLATRLAGSGLALPSGVLAALVSEGAASARVPAGLVASTARAAALVAAGQLAAGSTPAVVLMQGVMKAMLMKKLRLVVGAVMVIAALGAGGFAYQAGGWGTAQAAPPDKPLNELEALRKENELLKLNLQVVLEKVRAQEAEVQAARAQAQAQRDVGWAQPVYENWQLAHLWGMQPNYNMIWDGGQLHARLLYDPRFPRLAYTPWLTAPAAQPDVVGEAAKEAEGALKALREASDKEGQRRAAKALENAMKKLREQLK